VPAVTGGRRDITFGLFVVGIVLFAVAVVTGARVVYGAADILIGVSIAMFASQGAPPQARNAQLYLLGLAMAAAGAILDGIFTLADQGGIAAALTWVVVAGAVVALLGYGTPRR
jgi:FtsH-binding integral membrane protein